MPGFRKEPRLASRPALALLALAAPATLTAFCLGSGPGVWLGAAGSVLFPVALMALGAARGGRVGRRWLPLAALALLLAAGWWAILALPGGGPDVAGLPAATALMVFVLVPVPLLLLGLAYGLAFDRSGISAEDLERVRAAKRAGTEGDG